MVTEHQSKKYTIVVGGYAYRGCPSSWADYARGVESMQVFTDEEFDRLAKPVEGGAS